MLCGVPGEPLFPNEAERFLLEVAAAAEGRAHAVAYPRASAQRPDLPIDAKTEYVRDESYRRFVASLPCFACGIAGISQAAHSNQGGAGKGLSIKASDAFLFPPCADQPMRLGCHSKHDRCLGMASGERLERETNYLQRMKLVSNQVSKEVSKDEIC